MRIVIKGTQGEGKDTLARFIRDIMLERGVRVEIMAADGGSTVHNTVRPNDTFAFGKVTIKTKQTKE